MRSSAVKVCYASSVRHSKNGLLIGCIRHLLTQMSAFSAPLASTSPLYAHIVVYNGDHSNMALLANDPRHQPRQPRFKKTLMNVRSQTLGITVPPNIRKLDGAPRVSNGTDADSHSFSSPQRKKKDPHQVRDRRLRSTG